MKRIMQTSATFSYLSCYTSSCKMVKVITNMDEWKATTGTDQVCIVDMFAEWCGPCKMIAPKFKAFSEQYTTVTFLKLDVDAVPDVAELVGVSAMPTFQVWKNGVKIDELVGASPDKLEALILRAVSKV
ncbi:hypothetical protein CEUSTIGMA_g7508.t1 [Chlamydomonas eustigma]|uniref:Thioredoxin domain-containing protein n=1 Tax=Chlamydomonas eustigma TaxID=1157962 RepID=A0A250XBC4_9CHLO|nr:hypothetical protein CEUSTIGMA_g7508.t1 [Chlamydomonas eustigma]|eukprot:GAX80070.1 hypothetical protein CEUSTIGMA_g7508.t1 [Chlamydomonas eustigma]